MRATKGTLCIFNWKVLYIFLTECYRQLAIANRRKGLVSSVPNMRCANGSPTERAWEHNVWLVLYIVNDGFVAFKLILLLLLLLLLYCRMVGEWCSPSNIVFETSN